MCPVLQTSILKPVCPSRPRDNLSPFKTKSLLFSGDFNFDISNHQHHACLDSIQSKHDLKQVIATTPRVHIKAPIKHPQHSAPTC